MNYCIMEQFPMARTGPLYGVHATDRVALFTKAKELGFDGIEFGLTHDYTADPFWTGDGDLRQAMWQAANETGLHALSLCLHVLNDDDYSPSSAEKTNRDTARDLLRKSMEACHEAGVSVILVPFFGTARLTTPGQIDRLVEEIRDSARMAKSLGITLGLETSLDAPANLEVLERIGSDSVGIYFDVANTQGIGYDVEKEILETGSRIVQVHIKEHPQNPVLGKGEVDFRKVSESLHKVGFDGSLVFEVPTTEDKVMKANLAFMKGMIEA